MNTFLQISGWAIALLVSIGGALMFAPTYWGRLAACFLFAAAGLWGIIAAYMWSKRMEVRRRQRRLRLAGIIAADIILTGGLIWFALPRAEAQAPAAPVAPHDNTFYHAVPPPGLAQGSDNTVVGPTDSNGNTTNNGGIVVGSHACGGPGDVVIGSHANSASCSH